MKFTLILFSLAALTVTGGAADDQPPAKPAPKPAAAKGPRVIKLAMRDGLRFDPPRFSAAPGEEVVLEIENADSTQQPHNFILVKPGQRDAVIQQSLALGDKGPAQGFIPDDPNILMHSALLEVDKVAKINLHVPDTAGIYPYVCSFPGHGMVMYGALYAGVPEPALEKDPNIPPNTMQMMIAGNGRRPFIQRAFMPDSGPASIAVALDDEQNYCWDAGQCRLRYAWKGSFIDTSAQWKGNGNDLAKLPTAPWWRAAKDEFPLRFGTADAPAPAVKFLGYHVEKGVPEFHYRVNDAEVFEKITSAEKGAVLALHYRIPKAPAPVFFRGAPEKNPADFTITLTAAQP